jgi:hypothetical protein
MEARTTPKRFAMFNFRSARQDAPDTSEKEWKPIPLRKSFSVCLLIVEVGIIVSIIALERRSARNHGLATVPQIPADSLGRFSAISLLWTTLPVVLMAVYRLGWDAIVNATAARQPYIDLNRKSTAEANLADRTIMMDYRSYPGLYNWYVAFSKGQVLIGIAMILSLTLSIALVPLTSHLLVATTAVIDTSFNARIPNTFDSSYLFDLDIQPALSLASATLAFNAEPQPWTTGNYSFEPFDLGKVDGPRNYTVPVNTYYGQLDCVFLDVPPPEVTVIGGSDNATLLLYDVDDRGCNVPSVSFGLADPPYLVLARTFVTYSCGEEAHTSRLVLMAGNPISNREIANFTAISCIPSYWNTTGELTVSADKNSSPKVQRFLEHSDAETEFRPVGADVFEVDVVSFFQLDPKGDYIADLLGFSVYQLAQKRNPGSPMDSLTMKDAIGSMWQSIFAVMTTTFLIRTPEPRKVPGRQTSSENRLFIYPPIAWAIVSIIVVVALCNMLLILHAERNHSMLKEEPKGLFGAAVLLSEGAVAAYVESTGGKQRNGLTVRKIAQTVKPLAQTRFWYDGSQIRSTLADEEHHTPSGTTQAPSPANDDNPEAENTPEVPDAQQAAHISSEPTLLVQDAAIAQIQEAVENSVVDGPQTQGPEQPAATGLSRPPSPVGEDTQVAQGLNTVSQHGGSGGDEHAAEDAM